MAYIRQVKGKWKAEVERRGSRSSQTFETEEAAREWATARERVLIERGKLKAAMLNEVLISHLPRRVLEAAAKLPYSRAEILSRPIPMPSSGVYFLLADDDIIYIGQSLDVLGRIARHRREGKEFNAFNVIPCAPERLDELEAMYIVALAPWLNHTLGNRIPA